MYNLVIKRKKSIFGAALAVDITIDGSEILKLRNGDALEFNVKSGECKVTYDFWCRSKKEIVLNIEEGKNYVIQLKYDALLGGFKLDTKNSILE